MPRIERFRQKVLNRSYILSSHAKEEMAADGLDRIDVENAIFKGMIDTKLTEDARGTRYCILGPATDGRDIHVVVRFKEPGELLVITVYALEETI